MGISLSNMSGPEGAVIGALTGATAVGAAIYLHTGTKCPAMSGKGGKPNIKLSYFKIEGRAEYVRLALAVQGIEFEDERVSFAEWCKLKPSTPYGQLPIMSIDGGKPFGQSKAMFMFASKLGGHKLYPESKRMQIDEMLGLCEDIEKAWMPCLYVGMRPQMLGHPADWSEDAKKAVTKRLRETFVAESLPKFMGFLTTILEREGPFLCGKEMTLADIYLLPILRAYRKGHIDFVPTDCLDQYGTVTKWLDTMHNVQNIKAWYAAH